MYKKWLKKDLGVFIILNFNLNLKLSNYLHINKQGMSIFKTLNRLLSLNFLITNHVFWLNITHKNNYNLTKY